MNEEQSDTRQVRRLMLSFKTPSPMNVQRLHSANMHDEALEA